MWWCGACVYHRTLLCIARCIQYWPTSITTITSATWARNGQCIDHGVAIPSHSLIASSGVSARCAVSHAITVALKIR